MTTANAQSDQSAQTKLATAKKSWRRPELARLSMLDTAQVTSIVLVFIPKINA